MSQHVIKKLAKVTKDTPPGQYIIGNKVVTHTGLKTRVQQSDKHLTDLNKLLEPAMLKGALRHSVKFAGQYDDIPYSDYQSAQMKIAEAKTMYEELPMNIRKEFKTPGEFLKFVQNPQNGKRMQEMGILKGNDGLTATGANAGTATPTDVNGDGIQDPQPKPAETTP